jgi:aldehyde dehydrogenase (NAD+)
MTVAEALDTLPYGEAPEAAAPAIEWLEKHDRRFGQFVGGKWRAGGTHFDAFNPATAQPLAQITQASGKDVDDAVKAARKAFKTWGQTSGHVRARYLYAIARQVQKHSRLFAVLETLDNGKPIRETRDLDIPLAARHFYHHAGWAQLMAEQFPGYGPVGVCAQVIPWNFPLLMMAWKVAPALAMGNTVVLKPAEFTSLTALLFAELCEQVGLPPGVFNLVTGDGEVGAALVGHADVDKVAFTGSTDVGRIIRRQTAGSGKKLSLELGGKSPFVVFDDADLDSAVEGVVDAIWFNQGQVCCAGSRLLVQEGVAERFVDKLRARMETLRVGDPLDKAVDIGAIVAPVQLQRIQQLVQQGVDEGAELWQPSWAVPTEGCFYPPTLFTNVAPASTIAQVEIFGPVLASMTFRTPAEAVALANNTRFGLAASLWSEDINLALDVATQLKAGTVWINATNLFDAASGFGGYRESGFGREGGKEGLWEYVKRAEQPEARKNGKATASTNGHASGHDAEPGGDGMPPIDRTAKLFIGGKQARPDGGYSLPVYGPDGRLLGEVGQGNRKDVRNAVEAARKAADGWAGTTGHNRAQILFYLGENLAARADEFARRLAAQTGADGRAEVDATVEALFSAAAWADKYDGVVHDTPIRNVTLAVPEPLGVLAVLCPDDHPLLALGRLAAHAFAMGNAVVVVPSPAAPLAATDFYQVLETSDVPAGTFNVVTGRRDELAKTLAEHDDVDGIWYAGEQDGQAMVENASAGNMKRTWVHPATGPLPATDEILRHATQVKNIWVPYGA